MRRLLACGVMFSLACAHSQGARYAPNALQRIDAIAAVAVVAQVKSMETDYRGETADNPEETAAAEHAVAEAVARRIAALGFVVRDAPPLDEEARVLSVMVANSIVDFTYVEPFPLKLARFEYSIGSVASLCRPAGADGVVLAWGVHTTPTTGRVLLHGASGYAGLASTLMIALIDCAGDVLWFNAATAAGQGEWTNLAKDQGADAMVKAALSEFPIAKAP